MKNYSAHYMPLLHRKLFYLSSQRHVFFTKHVSCNCPFKIIYKKGLIMKTLFPLIFLSFIISGCFSSTLVTPTGEKGDLSYPQFNEKFGNDDANILLRDGQDVSGEAIYVGHDSISWFDPDLHKKISVPLENLRNVHIANHTLSALVGLGIGAAIGVVVALTGTSGPQHDGGGAGFYWLIAPPAGALLGVAIGAPIGWPFRYEFPKDTTSTHVGNDK